MDHLLPWEVPKPSGIQAPSPVEKQPEAPSACAEQPVIGLNGGGGSAIHISPFWHDSWLQTLQTARPLLGLYVFFQKTTAWGSSKTIPTVALTLLAHMKQTLFVVCLVYFWLLNTYRAYVWKLQGSLTLHGRYGCSYILKNQVIQKCTRFGYSLKEWINWVLC